MAQDKEPIAWITRGGKHIPIFADGPSDDEKKKDREIEENKKQADEKNEKKSKVDEAFDYAKSKNMDSYSYKELIEDIKYEHKLNAEETRQLEDKVKMYALAKGKFEREHKQWKEDFKKRGFDYDKEMALKKPIGEKQHDPNELIPKDSYTNDPKFKEARQWLAEHSRESQEVSHKWLEAGDALEKAKMKHVTPEMREALGREAYLLIDDDEFPDVAELRAQERKLYQRKEELEKLESQHLGTLRKFKKAHSEGQRLEYGRPDFEDASGKYPGFKTNETRTPYIDDLIEKGKARVVEMTPEQYIHECAHYVFNDSTVESVLVSRLGDKDTEQYAKMMREGVKFDTPYINYSRTGEQAGNQEGLHRAVAAYMNGLEKIPVVIIGDRRR